MGENKCIQHTSAAAVLGLPKRKHKTYLVEEVKVLVEEFWKDGMREGWAFNDFTLDQMKLYIKRDLELRHKYWKKQQAQKNSTKDKKKV